MLQEPGPSETRVGLGRRRRRAAGQGPLRRRRHAPPGDRGREIADAARRAPRRGAPRPRRERWPGRRAPALDARPRGGRAGARRGAGRAARRARPASAEPADGGDARCSSTRRSPPRRRRSPAAAGVDDRRARRPRDRRLRASPSRSRSSVWNAGGQPVEVESVALESPDGWARAGAAEPRRAHVAPGKLEEWKLAADRPGRRAADGPLLPAPAARRAPSTTGARRSALRARRAVPAAGPARRRARSAHRRRRRSGSSARSTFRFRDEAIGEIRRPVRAAPARRCRSSSPDLLVWPLGQKGAQRLEVTLTSNSPEPVKGGSRSRRRPAGPPSRRRAFALAKRGGPRSSSRSRSRPPATLSPGRGSLADHGGAGRRRAFRPRHPPRSTTAHPAARRCRSRARSRSTRADIRLPPLRHVGYVRGAADRVPEALLAVGVPVEISHRARPRRRRSLALRRDRRRQPRLRDGPALAARQRPPARLRPRRRPPHRAVPAVPVRRRAASRPYTLEITRPHDRVTDETAPVTAARSATRSSRRPTAIGAADWDGWVQERGLYFAHTWAPAYTPLLAMADPGEPEQQGGLLVAAARQGPLRLHGARVLPAASRRRARRLPSLRQPARVEGEK